MKLKTDWKVENIVATAALNLENEDRIDLNELAKRYDSVYNPTRFPGLVMRINQPKTTFLIFSNGKMVITGARLETDINIAVTGVVERIRKIKKNMNCNVPITITNLVASGDLHMVIDLDEAAIILDNTMFEPEVFPGLVYRMQDPVAVFLLFRTGKIVCTGCKNREVIGKAIEKLEDVLEKKGIAGKAGNDSNVNDDEFAFAHRM